MSIPSSSEELVSALARIGLSRNEALAYLTLLSAPEAEGLTGYEVAGRSGIPRSAVYAVLRKLVDAEAAFPTGDRPARYQATAPERLVKDMRTWTLGQLDKLSELLTQLPKRVRPEPVWTFAEYDEVLRRANTLIRSAESSVYLSIWSRELRLLLPALNEVAERPLHRVLHCLGVPDSEPAEFSCWVEDLSKDRGKAAWAHRLMLVVDRHKALLGGSQPGVDNHAVLTSNPTLVDMAINHIILDITLLAKRRGRDCTEDVGPMIKAEL